MADDANFVNGHLRLKCFLRLAQNLPPSPARCRRQLVTNLEGAEHAQQEAETSGLGLLQPDVVPTSISSGHQAAKSIEQIRTRFHHEKRPEQALQERPVVTQSLHQSVENEPFRPPSLDSDINGADDRVDRDVQASESHAQPEHDPAMPSEHLYTGAEHKRIDGVLRKVPRTRKRILPVNKLALVRTTTDNGLPDRSSIDNDPTSPIVEIDPSEDSYPVGKPHQEVVQSVRQTKPFQRAVGLDRSSRSKGYRRGSRPVADGFEPAELSFYPVAKRPMKTSRTIKKKVKVEAGRPPLAIITGSLPIPIMEERSAAEPVSSRILPLKASPSRKNPIPRTLHFGEDMAVVACRSDVALPNIHQKNHSSKSQEYHKRRPIEKAVLHQLASVTAPERRGSDSDSSSAEDQESDASSDDDVDIASNPSSDSEQDEQENPAPELEVEFHGMDI